MIRRSAAWFAAFVAVSSTGCGIGVSGSDDGGDGDGQSCTASFSKQPLQPRPGDEIQLTAQLDEGDLSGFETFSWTVLRSRQPLEIADADEEVIEFVADEVGIYTVELNASVGGQDCIGESRDFNVVADGARSATFRLRVLPADSAAPPQETSVQLWGGTSEYSVDHVLLEPGTEVSGVSRDASDAPIPAYLRARALDAGEGPPLYSETFASEDGAFALRLRDADHELLVIPDDPSLPPYRHASLTLGDFAVAAKVQPADTFAVSVRSGADGAVPVVGARVSLVVGGVPSSVATTGDDGQAELQVTAERVDGGAVSVTVVPPDADGLPRLELPVSEGVILPSGPGEIGIVYDPSLTARQVEPAVVLAGGGAADGSRVTWIARPMAGAGTVTIAGGSHAATGMVRRTALAPAGAMTPTLLPEAIYDAVIEPPDEAARDTQATNVTEVDLRSGAPDPAELGLAAPARLVGRVLAPGEEEPVARAGVRVQATPRTGLLLGAPRAGATDITGEDGSFTLLVAAGGEYELTADGAPLRQGRVRIHVTAPEPGAAAELDAIELPRVLRATGVIAVASGGDSVAGAHLQLFCETCGPEGGALPVGETLTDDVGRFFLTAPDPGVDPPALRP
jgi:hypothetical protein